MLRQFKNILLFGGLIAMACSCDSHYSSDRIRKAPVIDKAFYENSLDYLNKSIERYPSNADNYYKKALVLMEFENFGSAMLQAKKAVKIQPDDPEYLYLLAQLYAYNKKPELAVETALAATNQGASRAKFSSLLAEMYLSLDSLDLARDFVDRAIAEQPQKKFNYYLKGKVALALGDTVGAEKNILVAIEDSVLHQEAYMTLSRIYYTQEKFPEAGALVQQLLNQSPGDKTVLYEKGRILQQMNLNDSATQIFWTIAEIDSTFEEAYAALSELYYLQNRLDSAIFYTEKALEIRPSYIGPMLTQARILDRRRQYSQAIEQYENILAIDADNTTASAELQYLKRKLAYLQRQRESQRQREIQTPPTLEPVF